MDLMQDAIFSKKKIKDSNLCLLVCHSKIELLTQASVQK